MEEISMTPADATRTVKVIVRHSAKCNEKGAESPKCQCPKAPLVL